MIEDLGLNSTIPGSTLVLQRSGLEKTPAQTHRALDFPLRQVHVTSTFLAHFARWQRLRQDI